CSTCSLFCFMSWLQSELSQTLARTPPSLDQLSALIDPQWIEQALQATGKTSIRRRKLPAEHMVWLVIGLALFRNQPTWHVVRQLGLTLDGQPMAAPSAAVQARQRLGDEPLQQLFTLLTSAWTSSVCAAQCVQGLRVLAVDGVVWSALDTPEKRQSLGCCANQHGPGSSP
ncbi:MAG: transposase domain-containing protein, partial [Rhodoferax sp.]|uniref:transposase domain-containing protein n=1 Tax=Rhodoferax sp. TaxID=50421 RepID=UPI003265494C